MARSGTGSGTRDGNELHIFYEKCDEIEGKELKLKREQLSIQTRVNLKMAFHLGQRFVLFFLIKSCPAAPHLAFMLLYFK